MREIRERLAEIAVRETALRARERELDDRLMLLDQAARDAVARERAARDAAAEEYHHHVRTIEAEALRKREDALALRDLVEEREAETRQAALELEVEAESIAKDRHSLEIAFHDLGEQRARAERELDAIRSRLETREQEIEQARRSVLAAPTIWWLRSTVIAAGLAALAALAWLEFDQPAFRAAAVLRVASQSDAHRVSAEHAAAILAPGRIAANLADPGLRERWSAAAEAGRVRAVPARPAPSVRIEVTDPDPGAARHLASIAAEAYATEVNSVPEDELDPAIYADVVRRNESVHAELAAGQEQEASLAARLAALPAPADRDALLAEVHRLRDEQDQVLDALADAHVALDELRARGRRRGTIDPVALEQRLAGDPQYAEDAKQLAAASRQFGVELSAATLPVDAPLAQLQSLLQAFSEKLQAQRELTPTEQTALVLDQCSEQCDALRSAAAAFQREWSTACAQLERARARTAVVDLVSAQTAAAAAARDLRSHLDRAVNTLAELLDALTAESAGQTRGIVIASHLRAPFAAVRSAAGTLQESLLAIDTRENFRLDALDRQVRGTRDRLTRRRDAIQQDLQIQADRDAATQYAAEERRLLDRIARLKEERDLISAQLVSEADTLRALDEALALRLKLEAEWSAWKREVARLVEQTAHLEETLAQARRAGPRPDRIELSAVSAEQVAGRHRTQSAALSGGAAFAATWLISLLLLLKNPLQIFRARRLVREARTRPVPGLAAAATERPTA